MSAEREPTAVGQPPAVFESTISWAGGAAAGLVATVVMGVAISLVDLTTLQGAIAGLYGQSGNLVAGWAAHLAHGTIFGVVFAVLLAGPGLFRLSGWWWKTVVAGVVYGLVLSVVGAGIIMPIWLSLVGLAAQPSLPHLTLPLLGWHLLYGAVLGGLFPALEGR